LLKSVDLTGWLVTTDAFFTKRKVAKAILGQKGDYLMAVKQNAPLLLEDISYLLRNQSTWSIGQLPIQPICTATRLKFAAYGHAVTWRTTSAGQEPSKSYTWIAP
jgi:hypothetical protein